VIAAGGTAGHVVPALAVAAALRADGAEVCFVGGGRAEAELVPAAGFELHPLATQGLDRSSARGAARAVLVAGRAVVRARALLACLHPEVVMGGGGYVAGPVCLAALSRGVPIVLTEADSRLGLANRLLAPFARRVCLAFALPGRAGPRYRVTGRPTLPATSDRGSARARFGLADGETCVLVFGGSLGARSLNLAALQAFAGAGFRVLHVCGRRDHAELSARSLPERYALYAQLQPADFERALAAADLVVARSGGSVFEIAGHGLPAILVPYPHATGDHQTANARWMAEAGAAVVLGDDELTAARLAREVAAVLGDGERLAAMAAASARLARPDAAARVADELIQAAGG
jgi:UDP-N-acetylglucosamine--N-acetylmuramyl-(pentapeptide) pyrophosphoryl-undecaprenol N-acetylglucosamine transferase